MIYSQEYETVMIIATSIARDLSITPAGNLGHFTEVNAGTETSTGESTLC